MPIKRKSETDGIFFMDVVYRDACFIEGLTKPSQIDRWLKQSQILDGETITTTDTAIIFKKISG